MRGSVFKAWREGAGLSQQQAADRAGVNKRTVIRAEGEAAKDVPMKLAAVATPELLPDTIRPAPLTKRERAAQVADRVKAAGIVVTPELRAAMLRNPPYAKTAAEAKAMRALRAEQKGVALSLIRLLPLRPDWRRLDSGRTVNAAIPQPLDEPAPPWAGPRGVLTVSGKVYDYEAAHEMKPPHLFGAAVMTAGDW